MEFFMRRKESIALDVPKHGTLIYSFPYLNCPTSYCYPVTLYGLFVWPKAFTIITELQIVENTLKIREWEF